MVTAAPDHHLHERVSCLAARPGLRGHDTVQRLTVYVEALSWAGRGANGFSENAQGSDGKPGNN